MERREKSGDVCLQGTTSVKECQKERLGQPKE